MAQGDWGDRALKRECITVAEGLKQGKALSYSWICTLSHVYLGQNQKEEIPLDELLEAQANGKLEEVFGTGTAAVVSPVKELRWKGQVAHISGGQIGPMTQKLYDTLTGIQWGKLPDTKGWTVPVDAQ